MNPHHNPIIAWVQMDQRLKQAAQPVILERIAQRLLATLFKPGGEESAASDHPQPEQSGLRDASQSLSGVSAVN